MKLSDFGCASSIRDAKRETFCGTMDYQSPEMLMEKEYDTSTDLWSLGILAYELLVGSAPRLDRSKPEQGLDLASNVSKIERLNQFV